MKTVVILTLAFVACFMLQPVGSVVSLRYFAWSNSGSISFYNYFLLDEIFVIYGIIKVDEIITSCCSYQLVSEMYNKVSSLFNEKRGFPNVLRDQDSLYLKAEILY